LDRSATQECLEQLGNQARTRERLVRLRGFRRGGKIAPSVWKPLVIPLRAYSSTLRTSSDFAQSEIQSLIRLFAQEVCYSLSRRLISHGKEHINERRKVHTRRAVGGHFRDGGFLAVEGEGIWRAVTY
jgi:hypothetical protein